MKTNYRFNYLMVAALMASIGIVFSCQDNEEIAELENKEKEILLTAEEETIADSLPIIVDEIVAIEANPDSLKSKIIPSLKSSDYILSNNLFAIRDLPINLKARGGGNTGNLYLSTDGKNRELKLVSAPRRSDYQFYLRVLPASTGIPYLIYSRHEGTPISIGYYTSNPNRKILFTLPNESGSLYSASWDILGTANNKDYVVIESQSYMGQGSSGNYWDMFYHVIEVQNYNRIGFGKYTQKPGQEFVIIPQKTFTLKSIKFVNEYSATLTPRGQHAVTRAYTNSSYSYTDCDLVFNDDVYESSNFKENPCRIEFKVNTPGLYKTPEVAGGQLFLQPSQNIKPTLPYAPNQFRSLKRTLDGTLLLNVKPRTRMDVTYFYSIYNIKVNYEAVAVYNDRKIKFTGKWTGKVYVDDLSNEHFFIETNLDTNQTKSGSIKKSSNTKRIKL
jgi:hypothetical protein